jgi:gluconokinase
LRGKIQCLEAIMPRRSAPEGPLVLSLDVGTSSVRAMIWDRNGDWMPGWETEIEHTMTTTPDGGVETSAEQLFKRTARCIDGVLEQAGGHASAIAAVGMSTFWHNLLGVDADGRPLTPIYTWADLRSQGAAEQLKQRLDERAVHARTGATLHSSYLPAKLLWLSQTQPELFGQVRSWMGFGEYFLQRLFGRAVVSVSIASGTGLMDQDSCTWDQAMLQALPISAGQLSEIVDAGNASCGLGKKWAKRWPALKDVAWYPALGDGACSNVGCNCVTRERMALSVGTSAALRVLWPANGVHTPWGLWRYRLDREHIILGGALSNGGNLVRWLRATLQLGKRKEAAETIAALDPDAHGLTVLPFLAGERNPDYRSDARAAIVGLGLATTPIEIARASLEAVSYRIGLLHRLLAGVVPEAQRIVVNGGAILKRPYWIQITADVTGAALTASSEAEATSRGAALMALRALGEAPSLEAAADRLGEGYTPDAERHAVYVRAAARQQRLYDLLLNSPTAPGSAVLPPALLDQSVGSGESARRERLGQVSSALPESTATRAGTGFKPAQPTPVAQADEGSNPAQPPPVNPSETRS